MSRKVIVTSGLILVGQQTRSYIGLTLVIAGMYGTLFCWMQPLQDLSENRLMSTSLAVTVVNLVIGAVSQIPTENIPAPIDPYMDAAIFNILLIGANTLVIGLPLGKLVSLRVGYSMCLFCKDRSEDFVLFCCRIFFQYHSKHASVIFSFVYFAFALSLLCSAPVGLSQRMAQESTLVFCLLSGLLSPTGRFAWRSKSID